MKTASFLLSVIGIFGISVGQAQGQSYPSVETETRHSESTPLYRVTMVARTTKAINYGHLSAPTRIDFRGTNLLPLARGQAKVESKRGAVKIQTVFDRLQPAAQFGPEYLTYVLWAVTPQGRATNLGEVLLEGARSRLDVTAEFQAFALVVTAEPYFAVMQPSDVVVMENAVRPDTAGSIEEIDAKFDLLQRGQYASVSADIQTVRMDPKIPLGLYEARNAVKIAQGTGADRYAADSYQKAEEFLEQAENYQARNAGKKQVEMIAREAVQTAEDAREITVKRQEQEHQAMERQASAEREARAKAEAEEAVERTAQAEAARAEAERAKLEAQLAAERAARERAEVEAARAGLLAQQQALQAETEKARQNAEQADRLRQQAEAEKAELRARLLNQLNLILQTRDSVRGLIVNMSDVLFDSGSYTLRPAAREKLAKISGIVLAYPGLNLQVEGHTDSVGSDEFNQQLSERRAGSVRDFIVQQGVPPISISARGFGKTQPVSTNETGEGRQQNRRVELVVTGEAIGTTTADTRSSLQ